VAAQPIVNAADLTVDVVIDNYNYGQFVAEAVESALAQTHPSVTVTVVDDGSTDESREILRAYGGAIELLLKENGGQASAINAGFARSDADVVIFLDADDLLKSEAAAIVAAAFAADREVVKVQYRMEIIDEQARPTGLKPPRHLPLPSGDLRRAELTFPFDLVWLPTSGNAFRADALRRIMPMPEGEFPLYADWYLVHLTPLLGRVVSLEEVGACYRVHAGNAYELQRPQLDLEHVRQSVTYAAATIPVLEQLADELGLDRAYDEILSVADLANRLVSLKLEPDLHPNPRDRVRRLALDGARAAARRFDVAAPMKLLYIGWFAVTAAAPAPLARRLAQLFLFPERRARTNRLLGHFHGGGTGTAERQHYAVEVELAARLRAAPQEVRLNGLYTSIYAERLRRIPRHPLLMRSRDPVARERATQPQLRLLAPFLTRNSVFMEVGPGDCALALAVAARVETVYAVDVTDGLVGGGPRPDNFQFVSTNGVAIPVPTGTVDVAYSNQVMEHLHPDDAREHLRGVYAALGPGGRLVCITPNRLSGPWDISRDFDDTATGLHLKEYTISELTDLLRATGFSVSLFASYEGRRLVDRVPERAVRAFERVVEHLPRPLRRPLASGLVAVKVVATKHEA
jgi:glycosyltransferase involved in cell wall biosynthesis/SAM-dependent methyltransferase